MSKLHDQKVVLVTGGAGGLGRAIAELFLSEGARVAICDINPKFLAEYKEKVAAAHPNTTLVVECDITSESALDDLFTQIVSKFGSLDYAINSAGIMDRFDPAGTTDRELLDKVLAVNLVAPTMISKRAVNLMLEKGVQGSIVNIASVASFRGFAAGAAYTMSKHGLLGLTRNTASFYRQKGIRCNAIQCGAMATNIGAAMANGFNQEGYECMAKLLNWDGAMAELENVAKLTSYLCSEAASPINGAIVTADGGVTI